MSHRGGEFRRELGVYALIAMSLGTVIGSGWLLLPGIVASQAGPAAVISWIIAGLMVLVIAVVYAEMGAAWPAPGAVAKYPQLSHGRFVGHMAGWAAFIAYAVVPSAEAVAVIRYAGRVWPGLTNESNLTLLGIAIAIAILAIIGLLNFIGVKYLGIFENYVTALKYIPIVLFLILIPLFAFHPLNLTGYGGFAPTGSGGILIGISGTLFAYNGFRQALDFAAEAKNPGRDLPRALIGTILIATITYALISIVFVGGINWSALEGIGRGQWNALSQLSAPMYAIAAATGVGFLGAIMLADGIISPSGTNATNVGAVPRITYTMAEDGTLPQLFQRLHPDYGTPGAGLLVGFFVEVGFLLVNSAGYSALITAANVAFTVAYAIGPVSMITLRRTAPHVKRPYSIRGGRFLAPIAFFFASLLLYWEGWPSTGHVLGILLFGAIIYLGYAMWGDVSVSSIKNGIWLICYLVIMAVISYVGSSQFGGINVIPFGWDIVVIAILALIFQYWGVRQRIPYSEENEPESATIEKTGPAPTDTSPGD